MSIKRIGLALSIALFGQLCYADEDWWFDVEVIVFDRNESLTTLKEQFEYVDSLRPPVAHYDLIGQLLQPDIRQLYRVLPQCEQPESAAFEQNLANSLYAPVTVPAVAFCHQSADELITPVWPVRHFNESLEVPAPDAVPLLPESIDRPYSTTPHLLPAYERQLSELSKRIRSERGLTRLLHVVWRQEVKFGRENADTFRLIAGKNYASDFLPNGQMRRLLSTNTPTEDAVDFEDEELFWDTLRSRLASPEGVPFKQMVAALEPVTSEPTLENLTHASSEAIWQVDGLMKVFLRYINRVPYLHIDSELFYRQPIPVTSVTSSDVTDGNKPSQPEFRLVSVPFKQLRRVISKQIHYFDHPLFGMVVVIRRHQRPDDNLKDDL